MIQTSSLANQLSWLKFFLFFPNWFIFSISSLNVELIEN